MKLQLLKPAKSLNKAYFKQSLKRGQIELFKTELQNVFNHTDEKQDEEYHKNLISQFLLSVYCKDKYLVNVNKRQDLVIRLSNSTTDNVGVILEFKKPTEKKEMVSADKPNVKALQELVLYYLRETIDNDNYHIKYLIATNIYEWFIFDEVWFEKNIFRNGKLKKEYKEWKVSGHDTKHFYELIAAKHLDTIEEDVSCTYFNLKDFEKFLLPSPFGEGQGVRSDDNKLIDLYKILSPEHLLKKPFANDSNTLNKEFYNELLYIIGLEEKSGARKLIDRKETNERSEGSLLENTITVLKRMKHFGYDENEETEKIYFDLALELCITWLNRILFLKLLEGQLIKYHRGDISHSFLNINRIKDFDELDELFFEVLAEPHEKRTEVVSKKYSNIPYLNSSLFERSEYELKYGSINQLKDRLEIPIYNSTVLKDTNGKRISGKKLTLQYLFEFLGAYNFASDSSAEIQENNKTIINASVLGLIFEKINGYKDGSFFTPGFITMYMCRETIRKAVLQKFNEANEKWNCKTYEELKDKIDHTEKQERKKANDIINTIKICDPAVGSGHFLVSALNELIAIKSDLHILNYRDESRVKGFKIEIANDELIITNEEADQLFNYTLNQSNKPIDELQQLQETLFHEKQDLIEKCLFGVDINPKSVLICRLRLWIELLKNSYYTKESKYEHLETLPNIDINIKCGNSLISRFAIADDVFENVPNFIKKLDDYKFWVNQYKETNDKKLKDQLHSQIEQFKNEFKKRDPRLVSLEKQITKASEEIIIKYKSEKLFGSDLTEKQVKHRKQLEENLQKLVAEKKTILNDNLYQDALEWRFEFPEVLDNKGLFKGFDVVIGNPPYGVSIKGSLRNEIVNLLSKVPDYEIYYFFINLSNNLLRDFGKLSFIIPNTILFNVYAKQYRMDLFKKWDLLEILDCTDMKIFEDAAVRNIIFLFSKINSADTVYYRPTANGTSFEELIGRKLSKTTKDILLANNQNWALVFKLNSSILNLVSKIKNNHPLSNHFNISQGYIPYRKSDLIKLYGETKAKSIVENREWHSDIKINNEYKQEIWGANLSKYGYSKANSFIRYGKHLAGYVDLKYFNQTRLLIREITNPTIIACIVYEELVNDPQIISIIPKTGKVQIKLLWAIMNSTLATFYHFNSSPKATKGAFPKILVEDIKNFPLPEITNGSQNNILEIEKRVKEILSEKEKNPSADTSDLEKEIDKMVYELYNLTEEEIRIIDGKTK